jgi:hypothetical protein
MFLLSLQLTKGESVSATVNPSTTSSVISVTLWEECTLTKKDPIAAPSEPFNYKKSRNRRRKERRSIRRKTIHPTGRGVTSQNPVDYQRKLQKFSTKLQRRKIKEFWGNLQTGTSAAAIGDLHMAQAATSMKDKHKCLFGEKASEDRTNFRELFTKCLKGAGKAIEILERGDLLTNTYTERNVTAHDIIVRRKIVKK